MKKRNLLVAFSLLLAQFQFMQADDKVIIVRGTEPRPGNHSEVHIHGDGVSDTLNVIPSTNVTSIHVTLKDNVGTILDYRSLPAGVDHKVTMETPSEGYSLEISDNQGLIYAE